MNEQFYDSMADYYHLIFEDCAVGKSSCLQEVCVLPSSNTGFYQPIIVAEAA
jgi:hypothetical protein